MIDAACAAVSESALMAHAAEFARYVKLSGTPGERASLDYVRSCLDGFGYRTELLLHDAYISLPGPARIELGGSTLDAITHSFSRAADGLSAPLLDVGEGAAIGPEAAGRILLVEGIASPAVAARASAMGALGQIHISPREHRHEMCISPVWGSPSASTLPGLPTTTVCTLSHAAGMALRARLAQGESLEPALYAEVDTGWRPTPILVADLDGPADAPFILLSGHHDTWYYGVMDNGAANATMLEAARLAAGHRTAWRRGLRLCFWSGHSHGRYSGSAWYADHHWAELDRSCAAHVNVDSTGGIGATVLTDSATASELASLARAAVAAETGQLHAGHRSSRSSDASFWGVGIPSMFGSISTQPPSPVKMRNALGWWWHTPEDLLDKLDPAFLARDTRVVLRALLHLLTDPVLPLDYAAHAAALLAVLEPLGPIAAPLAGAARALQAAAAGPHSDHALMQASRALVPLDYTTGDRFTHDPALPQPPWPTLDPLRTHATHPTPHTEIDALRARNRALHALQTAEAALRAA